MVLTVVSGTLSTVSVGTVPLGLVHLCSLPAPHSWVRPTGCWDLPGGALSLVECACHSVTPSSVVVQVRQEQGLLP